MPSVMLKLNYQGIGKVALQSPGIRELITGLANRGASSAAGILGVPVDELYPKISFQRRRWYGTYGTFAREESRSSALSRSIGAMR